MRKKTIRIIAPSSCWKKDNEANYKRAEKLFTNAGWQVTYGKNTKKTGFLDTTSAQMRAIDFNEAFNDNNVDAVMALDGGYSSNSILDLIDWDIVKNNPKPLVGYSDITVLLNAVSTATKQITLMGPMFSTIGKNADRRTLDSLFNSLDKKMTFQYSPSIETITTVVQKGQAKGRLIGGNVGSFYLLQGTKYAPDFSEPYILAIEEDDEAAPNTLAEFDRRLESILQQKYARKSLQGVLVGRFEPTAKVTNEQVAKVLENKLPKNIPIVLDMDFGHTIPMATLPIGETVCIDVDVNLSIVVIKDKP